MKESSAKFKESSKVINSIFDERISSLIQKLMHLTKKKAEGIPEGEIYNIIIYKSCPGLTNRISSKFHVEGRLSNYLKDIEAIFVSNLSGELMNLQNEVTNLFHQENKIIRKMYEKYDQEAYFFVRDIIQDLIDRRFDNQPTIFRFALDDKYTQLILLRYFESDAGVLIDDLSEKTSKELEVIFGGRVSKVTVYYTINQFEQFNYNALQAVQQRIDQVYITRDTAFQRTIDLAIGFVTPEEEEQKSEVVIGGGNTNTTAEHDTVEATATANMAGMTVTGGDHLSSAFESI